MKKNSNIIKKFSSLFLGFFLLSLGITSSLHADLGMNPWGIFHMGIALQTGLTFGQAFQAAGTVIILLSIFLGIIPGIGTILNMYFVGFFSDLISSSGLMFTPNTIIGKLIMLLIGNLIFAFGTYFYLKPGLGGGPKDSLMLAISKKFNYPISIVRTVMELIAVTIGTILGGPLGVGTLIIAATTGYFIQGVCSFMNLNLKDTKQLNIIEFYKLLKAGEL